MAPSGEGGWVSEGRAARLTQAVVRWRCGQGSGDGRSVRRLGGRRGELKGGHLLGQRSKGSAARRGGHGGEWHG